jgi:hypothetical protein
MNFVKFKRNAALTWYSRGWSAAAREPMANANHRKLIANLQKFDRQDLLSRDRWQQASALGHLVRRQAEALQILLAKGVVWPRELLLKIAMSS